MSFDLNAEESQPDRRKRAKKASTRDLLECVALNEFSSQQLVPLAVVKAELAIRQNKWDLIVKVLAVAGGIYGFVSFCGDLSELWSPECVPGSASTPVDSR